MKTKMKMPLCYWIDIKTKQKVVIVKMVNVTTAQVMRTKDQKIYNVPINELEKAD